MSININALTKTAFVPRTFEMFLPALANHFMDENSHAELTVLNENIENSENIINEALSVLPIAISDTQKDEIKVKIKTYESMIKQLKVDKQALIEANCRWIVRGLTACEIAQANDFADNNENLNIIATALISKPEKIEAIKKLVGVLDDDTPKDFAKRLYRLVLCSVDPVIDTHEAVIFSQAFPIEFQLLTNKILELTGQGMDIKK